MTNMAEAERDACPDEGYEATEEEDEAEDVPDNISSVHGYRDIFKVPHLSSERSFWWRFILQIVILTNVKQSSVAIYGNVNLHLKLLYYLTSATLRFAVLLIGCYLSES